MRYNCLTTPLAYRKSTGSKRLRGCYLLLESKTPKNTSETKKMAIRSRPQTLKTWLTWSMAVIQALRPTKITSYRYSCTAKYSSCRSFSNYYRSNNSKCCRLCKITLVSTSNSYNRWPKAKRRQPQLSQIVPKVKVASFR